MFKKRKGDGTGSVSPDDAGPPPGNVTSDEIYLFYKEHLIPAIVSSIPILFRRLGTDMMSFLRIALERASRFLLPGFQDTEWSPPSLGAIWNQSLSNALNANSTFTEFMLRQFDTDKDGHISATELLHMNDIQLPSLPMYHPPQSWFSWFQRSWPMLDWKLGVFLWRTCSGLLIVIAIATILPGRMHGYSGRLLRFPILGLTYFMITVELVVYTFIRLFIRLAEATFAHPKHRALRRAMAKSKSYAEWYRIATELDKSQKRDKWRLTVNDDTSYQYNWAFINELINDLRGARTNNDPLLALAVLQQCTRKNVGGVMSEDLFSYTNTGEPKVIVIDFIEEVEITLKWLTNQAKAIPLPTVTEENTVSVSRKEKEAYEEELKSKVSAEKHKIFGSVVEMAVMPFVVGSGSNKADKGKNKVRDHGQTNAVLPSSRAESKKECRDTGQNTTDLPSPRMETRIDNYSGLPQIIEAPSSTQKTALSFEHREHVKTFLKRARAAYGRTALCLSGGSMMGNYHFGHVKALLEEDTLPHIISGTSAGSAVAALVCTRNEEELERDLRPEVLCDKLLCFTRSWPERIRSYLKTGAMFDVDDWFERIKWFTCGDMTFEEAYRKTGRVFCITLSATTKKAPPVLVNHITAPHVVIASAIIASAAVPGFIHPVVLRVKDSDGVVRNQAENKDQSYWDGSIEQDIPTSGLAEMLNCQFFVAAQCNPHIVPFFYNSKGDVGRPSRWSSGMREDSWRGGFLLSALELYLKNDMRAKFHFLHDVEAAKGFHSSLFTQSSYSGSTTIVPQVVLIDYFKLFVNQSLDDLNRYFQGGTVAAYQHIAMIKLHYRIANALDECLAVLEHTDGSVKPRRRSMILQKQMKSVQQNKFPGAEKEESDTETRSRTESSASGTSGHDDQYETGFDVCGRDDEYETGFDGVELSYSITGVSRK